MATVENPIERLIDYEKLGNAIASGLRRGGLMTATEKKKGRAKILLDDCTSIKFEVDGVAFAFKKSEKESWVETVKNSHRNNAEIEVEYEGSLFLDDGRSRNPRDIHDASW